MKLHRKADGRLRIAVIWRAGWISVLMFCAGFAPARPSIAQDTLVPEQPDWSAEPSGDAPAILPDAPPTSGASEVAPPPPLAPSAGTGGAPPSVPTTPLPPAATFSPAGANPVGVPNAANFFLPDFGGRPFFERDGLRFRAGPVQLRMSLSTAVEHTDNVFGSSTNQVADNFLRVSPSIILGAGDFVAKAEDYFWFQYAPSFDYYQTQVQQNRLNQNLEIKGQATFSRYSTIVDLSYQTSSSPSATQTGGQEYSTLNFQWDNSYYLGAKTFARATAVALIQQSENNNNYQTLSINPQIGYVFSPKTTVFMGPFAGVVNVEQGGGQTFQGINVGMTYTNLRKLTFTGSFGVQARQFDGQDTSGAKNFVTPVLNFALIYQARQDTAFNLTLIRDVQLSDIQRGLTYTNSQIGLTATQKLPFGITFSLALQYQMLDYEGDSTQERTDQYISVVPSLGYTFWRDHLNVSLYYRGQKRTSDQSQFSYNVNSYGVQLTYNF